MWKFVPLRNDKQLSFLNKKKILLKEQGTTPQSKFQGVPATCIIFATFISVMKSWAYSFKQQHCRMKHFIMPSCKLCYNI